MGRDLRVFGAPMEGFCTSLSAWKRPEYVFVCRMYVWGQHL